MRVHFLTIPTKPYCFYREFVENLWFFKKKVSKIGCENRAKLLRHKTSLEGEKIVGTKDEKDAANEAPT